MSSAAFRAEGASKLQQCSFSHWIDGSPTDTWQQRVPILTLYGFLHDTTVKDLWGNESGLSLAITQSVALFFRLASYWDFLLFFTLGGKSATGSD